MKEGGRKMEELKKKIDSLWKLAKKDLEKVLKDTTKLMKKGEEYIKDLSERGKDKLEKLTLSLQREKLYYELGKTVSNLPKRRWVENKRIEEIVSKIRKINRQIKRKR